MKYARLALLLLAAGCPPPSTLPSGCGKDVDCKGTRICVAHACIDPPPRAAADGGPANTSDTSDGGALPDGGVASASADMATPALPPPIGASAMFHVDATHSGRSRFRAPVAQPKEVMHVATGGVVVSSPAIADDGTIVFGSHDKSIYAVDAAGKILWRHPTSDLVWSSPALGPGGVVYAGGDDDRVYAFDLKDGAMRWSFTTGPCRVATGIGPEGARCDVDGITVGPDGTVYVGCHDDALYAIGPDGQKRWDFRAGDDIDSSPAVSADGIVYFGSDDRKLYALGPGGALRWAVTTGGAIRGSPAIAADGTVYVGSFDGAVYAVRPGGVVAWSFRTADRIVSSPVIDAAGMVLIGSEDDRLYAISPDGKLAWSLLLDGDVDATPALGADGTIYIGNDDRALHALR